jgi:hypothetical protein
MNKKNARDLDSWFKKYVKIILNAESFYEGIFLEEQKNGILIESNIRRININ